jgi:uncharacterized protein (DUF1800 family)
MGQGLFYPPSVKGWDGGLAWLSAGGLVERMQVAAEIAARARDPAGALGAAFDAPPPTRSLALALACPDFQLN